jgi:hypothetical protein
MQKERERGERVRETKGERHRERASERASEREIRTSFYEAYDETSGGGRCHQFRASNKYSKKQSFFFQV